MYPSKGLPRPVSSSQQGIHPDLWKLVDKYKATEYKKPIAIHTQQAFESAFFQIEQHTGSIILDSGCGTGTSTLSLAEKYTDCWILGVDKSAHRLSKAKKTLSQKSSAIQERVCFVQADIIDFWRLLHKNNITIHSHYVLYPNPWPKKNQIQRRFHGHPIFPLLLNLAPKLELRSNWKIYLKEFIQGTLQLVPKCEHTISEVIQKPCLTAFEKKYLESGQTVWRLKLELPIQDTLQNPKRQ